MANIDEIKTIIRSGLEQLTVKNAYHDFEHLCRYLTKERICSNVIPATGPVSSGGDQGRDFETFRTYVNSSPTAHTSFVRLVSQTPIAFSCSLEKKETIVSKIKSDVNAIMTSGVPVEDVHYFCSADLEVSKRHDLQSWALQTHSIHLEIFNGEAIAELLSDNDTFWIAQKYLSIPAEIYQSPQSANQTTQLQPIEKPRYEKVERYLSRRVVQGKGADPIRMAFLKEELAEDLLTVLKKQKRIILLADAGAGKTTELKQIAAYYSKDDMPFYPYLVLLNKYTSQSISDLLPSNWGRVPVGQLLIILDGLDEIESKNKNDAIRQIELFCERFPEASTVVSCRSNFYRLSEEHFSGKLEKFTAYILLDLSDREIERYIRDRLDQRTKDFSRVISESNIYALLRIPFYLVSLVDLFVDLFEANNTLLRNKSEIFEHLLDFRMRHDLRKYRTTIRGLDEKRKTITKTLERLALAMEVLGRNYITDDEFESIVPDEPSRDLVKHCTVWKGTENPTMTWQFEHNNFQEYMAAKALSVCPMEEIISFISFGPNHQKVIPSWRNTLSFLVSILDKDADRFAQMFRWIKENEPELAIRFEPDRINAATRYQILKSIFDEYKEKQIVIDRTKYPFSELARFGQTDETIEFLLTETEEAEVTKNYSTLISAVELLGGSRIVPSQRQRLLELLTRLALNHELGEYQQGRMLIILTNLGLNTREVINQILPVLRTLRKDEVRRGLYYLLHTSDCLDENIDVFLEGISLSRSYDVERHLNPGFEKATSLDSVKRILEYLLKNVGDLTNTHFDSQRAIKTIAENASVYGKDPDVFSLAAGLFIALEVAHLDKEARALLVFFDNAGLRLQTFQSVFEQRSKITFPFPILADLADHECISFFVQQYEEGRVSDQEVRQFHNHLGYKNYDLYQPFNTLINEKSGNRFVLQESRDWDAERKQCRHSDISLLFDPKAFLEAIKGIFDAEEKEAFTEEELVHIQVEQMSESRFSILAIHTLRLFTRGKSVRLEEVIKFVEGSNWDFFCLSKLYEYLSDDEDIDLSNEQIAWIEAWVQANLNKVDFKTDLVKEQNGARASHMAIYLWYFLRRLDIQCPEDILLDMLSFDWIDKAQMGGIGYIEERVSKAKIETRILENLKAGIEEENVLRNHIGYCKRHKTRSALPFMLREIIDKEKSYQVREAALNAFIEVSGGISDLEELLPKIKDGFKWEVVKELVTRNSKQCLPFFKGILLNGGQEERLIAAKYLIGMRDLSGLEYYVEWTEVNKEFRAGFSGKPFLQTLREVDEIPFLLKSIPLLIRLLRLSYEEGLIQVEFHSLNGAVLETLSTIAMRSEECYQSVKTTVEAFIKTNISDIEAVRFLYYSLNTLEYSYYQNKSEGVSVGKAISKVDQIIRL